MAGRAPPCLEKGAEAGQYKLLFVDESAFYLLPGVVKTWAPVGQTPVLRHKLTRDHLSVISAVSPEGDLYLQVRECAFDSAGILGFLDLLQEQIEGDLVIVWDGAPIHRSKLVKQYLADGAAARLRLERLPGYAPELNPDEGIWHYLKHVEMKHLCCEDMVRLKAELAAAEQRLRQKPQIITACFQNVGYFRS
jgi:transposase